MARLGYCRRHPKNYLANDEATEERYQKRQKWSSPSRDLLRDLHLGEPFGDIEQLEEVE